MVIKIIRRLMRFLVLLVGFYLLKQCDTAQGLPPGRQYPVLFKQLTPLHSSNHIIISLSEIYRHFNGVYRDIQTHELVTIRCSNSTHIESVNVTSRDQRIFCHTLKPPPPFNNFCIERSTWTVRTRENYHPPLNADLVCIMKLRARGFEFDGQPRSNLYKLRIDIQARCTQQRAVREKILATCNPDLVILRPKMRENSFIYEVPQLEHPESVRLYLRKFAERQQSEILQIKINCDNEERSFNMNINTTDVVIDANCKPGTNRLRVSVISNWDRVHLADEQLNYFLMENVCIRQRCLNLHATLRYLLSSSAETDKCVASEFPLRETFDKCLARISVILKSSTSEFKYGSPVVLTCEHSKIYRPYTIMWYRVKGRKFSKIQGTGNKYHIPQLSHYHNARYACRIMSCKPTPCRLLQESRSVQIELSDVFSGQLSFRLPITEYGPGMKRKYKIEIEFALSSTNSSASQLQDGTLYNITSIRNVSDHVIVEGILYMVKNTSGLKTISNLEWMTRTIAHLKEKFPDSKMQGMSLNTAYGCASTSEYIGDDHYPWPSAEKTSLVTLTCTYNKSQIATRRCEHQRGKKVFAFWGKSNATSCQKLENIDMTSLSEITITSDNMLYISSKLLQMLSQSIADLSPGDVALFTKTLEKFVTLIGKSADVANNLMTTIDGIMGVEESVLKESEEEHKSASRLINLLGKFGDSLAARKPRLFSLPNFAFGAIKLSVSEFNGLTISVIEKESLEQLRITNSTDNSEKNTVAMASIKIPASIKEQIKYGGRDVDIVAVAHQSDNMFIVRDQEQDFMLNSHIISTEVRGQHLTNLEEPVQLNFTVLNTSIFNHEKKCMYWNITTNSWLGDGCSIQDVDELMHSVTCSCNHLTNFALLFGTIPPVLAIHRTVLSYVTYIGMATSFVGALFTLLTYLIFPMLRRKLPPKILINLCAAFLMMQLCFVIGDTKLLSDTGCKISSAFLQYFFLCVFSWSTIEGFQSFRSIVRPMSEEIRSFMMKASIFGWGLPLIFTGIGLSISLQDYSGGEWCVAKGLPFFFTIIAPIAAALIFNIICLVSISITIIFKARVSSTNKMDNKVRFRIITGFIVLFGITWLFGFFVISNNFIVYQYIFCILASLQGFYLFLFYCIRAEKNRWAWWQLLRCHNIKEIQRMHTRQSQMTRCNTYDTATSPMVSSLSTSSTLLRFASLLSKKGSIDRTLDRSENGGSTLTTKKNGATYNVEKTHGTLETIQLNSSSSTDYLNGGF